MAKIGGNKTGASRQGHHFHEAWMARRSLGLLIPRDDLYCITIEGLSVVDEEDAGQEAAEIADATFYYGRRADFATCDRIEIAQFKYSTADNKTSFTFSSAKKTIEKFWETEKNLSATHGHEAVEAKLKYFIITNKPVSADFQDALCAISNESAPKTASKSQYDHILTLLGVSAKEASCFAKRIFLQGTADDLTATNAHNARIIVDWSATNDALAHARLGELRHLIRNKSESTEKGGNAVFQKDILGCLGIGHIDELLPCHDAFPEVGTVLRRQQLDDFHAVVSSEKRWVITAPGGNGKTVFLQSLVNELSSKNRVVLFDCFGGSAYRSPADGRHRPERGLMHIVNDLSFGGLCDPILPNSSDPSAVIRASINRFKQAIATLRMHSPTSQLIIVIDAIDNAAVEAKDRAQSCFPKELLEALTHGGHPDGLVLISTCRPERLQVSVGRATFKTFPLQGFTPSEINEFVRARIQTATSGQIAILSNRSEGNPRVLATLLEDDPKLESILQRSDKVVLETLLEERLNKAAAFTRSKGATDEMVQAFLCALCRLPPPIPIGELAGAFGIEPAEAESFAADLSPLLQRTRFGLIFKDEPTETLVRNLYGEKLHLLDKVANQLFAQQTKSIYASKALPSLFFAMGRVESLRELALSNHFPSELDSEIARHEIRLNRINAGLGAAAQSNNFDAVVDLLVEKSSVVATDERGESYLCDHPDLVVALGDSEMLRRVSRSNQGWFGSRPARLTIAYTVEGDTGEALSNANDLNHWLYWLDRKRRDEKQDGIPTASTSERIAIPLLEVLRSRPDNALRYLNGWNEDYQYKLGLALATTLNTTAIHRGTKVVDFFTNSARKIIRAEPPLLVAFLSSCAIDDPGVQKLLLELIGKKVTKIGKIKHSSDQYSKQDTYEDSLTRAALQATHIGLPKASNQILDFVGTERYKVWVVNDNWSLDRAVPWILTVAARCAASGQVPNCLDCLPIEIWRLIQNLDSNADDKTTRKFIEQRISDEQVKLRSSQTEEKDKSKKKEISNAIRQLEDCSEAMRSRVGPILQLCRLIARVISTNTHEAKESAAKAFCDEWRSVAEKHQSYYPSWRESDRIIEVLYVNCLEQTLWALGEPACWDSGTIIERFNQLQFQQPETAVKFVGLYAKHEACHEAAGQLAANTIQIIEREDDVERRSVLFASLARAILPASKHEATLLFKRGLNELSAIGSGDHEFIGDALNFACTFREQSVKPELAFRFAKLCELNNYDTGKFPWPLAAKAFSRAQGPAHLAQLTRWHDRDIVPLSYTLPPTLTALINDRKLEVTDAVALLGLVEPVRFWEWDWHDFVEAVVKSECNQKEILIEIVIELFERLHPSSVSGEYGKKMIDVLTSSTLKHSILVSRLKRILEAGRSDERDESKEDTSRIAPAIKQHEEARETSVTDEAVDPLDSNALESFVENIDKGRADYYQLRSAFTTIRGTVNYAQRRDHINAVIAARNIHIERKLDILEDIQIEWGGSSPGGPLVYGVSRELLILQHLDDILNVGWNFFRVLERLTKITSASVDDLALQLVLEASKREIKSTSKTWIKMATLLSKKARPSVPVLAFERVLNGPAARLADTVGDGSWRAELNPGEDTDQIVASTVWFVLGSPLTTDRWRAAHVVRSLAKLGRWNIISLLVSKLKSEGCGAFQAQALPFYTLYAKQWFLLALARIAKDYPEKVGFYASEVESVAFYPAFPHVGMVSAAKACLLNLLNTPASRTLSRKANEIAALLVPNLPKVDEANRPRYDGYARRSEELPEPSNPFHFDHDFQKYKLTNLGRVFGLPNWAIGDLCLNWIRKWDNQIKYMSDFGGRTAPQGRSRHYDGNFDGLQSHGAYLARNAIALVGGELLSTTPVTSGTYDDPWSSWLSEFCVTRPDGLWLSDGTEFYPDIAKIALLKKTDSKAPTEANLDTFARLCRLPIQGSATSPFIVNGHWESPDSVSIRILSALAPNENLGLLATTVATAPPFHRWLPTCSRDEDDEHRSWRGQDFGPLEGWIVYQENEAKIDDLDPFGSTAAISHSLPNRELISQFLLEQHDVWDGLWKTEAGLTAFEAHAWGFRQGYGENEKWGKGNSLEVHTHFLKSVLEKRKRSLILMIELQHYQNKKNYGLDDDEVEKFTHSLAVVTIDRHLNVNFVNVTEAQTSAVAKLQLHEVPEFQCRCRALAKL